MPILKLGIKELIASYLKYIVRRCFKCTLLWSAWLQLWSDNSSLRLHICFIAMRQWLLIMLLAPDVLHVIKVQKWVRKYGRFGWHIDMNRIIFSHWIPLKSWSIENQYWWLVHERFRNCYLTGGHQTHHSPAIACTEENFTPSYVWIRLLGLLYICGWRTNIRRKWTMLKMLIGGLRFIAFSKLRLIDEQPIWWSRRTNGWDWGELGQLVQVEALNSSCTTWAV